MEDTEKKSAVIVLKILDAATQNLVARCHTISIPIPYGQSYSLHWIL